VLLVWLAHVMGSSPSSKHHTNIDLPTASTWGLGERCFSCPCRPLPLLHPPLLFLFFYFLCLFYFDWVDSGARFGSILDYVVHDGAPIHINITCKSELNAGDGAVFMSEHFCWNAKLERPSSALQNTMRGRAIIAMVEVDDRAAILCHREKHVILVEPTVRLAIGVLGGEP
jgi:hypothetical protein